MAGAYPNSPGRLMNTYSDGTILLKHLASYTGAGALHAGGPGVEETGTADALELVDHDTVNNTNWGSASGAISVFATYIFPELRDIDGTVIATNTVSADSASLAHSADTTNGLDGTWTEQSAVQATIFYTANEIPGHRDNVYAWSASAQRAVMTRITEGGIAATFIRGFEVFGEIAAGESPDRLLFIDDATGFEYNLPQDYGDRPRGSAVDVAMRVKNNSGTLAASTIDVSRGNHELGNDSSGWYTLDNGGGFAASFQIASLGAGAEDTFTLRQNIPDTAVPGVYQAWLEFDVNGSWS